MWSGAIVDNNLVIGIFVILTQCWPSPKKLLPETYRRSFRLVSAGSSNRGDFRIATDLSDTGTFRSFRSGAACLDNINRRRLDFHFRACVVRPKSENRVRFALYRCARSAQTFRSDVPAGAARPVPAENARPLRRGRGGEGKQKAENAHSRTQK